MEALVKTNEPPRWYFGIARHTRHARAHLPGVSKTGVFIERPFRLGCIRHCNLRSRAEGPPVYLAQPEGLVSGSKRSS